MRSVPKYKDITRRKFLGTTAAGVALAGVAAPNLAFGAAKTVKVGWLERRARRANQQTVSIPSAQAG